MQNLCRCRDLTALEAVIAAAFLVIALFGWSVGSAAVDPESLNVANWRWQLWQIGALLIAVPGVWWLWLGTQRVAWVRVLALGLFTLLVFVNTYTESLFGDYVGEVWQIVNPLFIAFAVIAAVELWRCGGIAGLTGAAASAALGVVDFINAFLVDHDILWQIMDPLMMLAALAWAAWALCGNVAASSDP